MGVVVQFNYAAWLARYPEFAPQTGFAGVDEPTATAYFTEAGLYHDNTGVGPPNDAAQQLLLLNMITAHLAQLYSGSVLVPASQIVGRISQASEGSVSVSTDMPGVEERAAFWAQTKYGLAYWQATRLFRTGHYRAPLLRTLPRPF